MMSGCPYQDIVMRYFDHSRARRHDLPPSDQEVLHRHLDSCPGCRALFNDFNEIFGVLETAPPVEPSPELIGLVLQQITPPVRRVTPNSRQIQNELAKWIYGSLAGAAAVLLAAISMALTDTSFFELLLQARRFLNLFSGIAFNLQIIYQLVNGLFASAIFSVFREIQMCFMAALFAMAILVLRKVIETARLSEGSKKE